MYIYYPFFLSAVFGVDLTTLVKLEGGVIPKVLTDLFSEIHARGEVVEEQQPQYLFVVCVCGWVGNSINHFQLSPLCKLVCKQICLLKEFIECQVRPVK